MMLSAPAVTALAFAPVLRPAHTDVSLAAVTTAPLAPIAAARPSARSGAPTALADASLLLADALGDVGGVAAAIFGLFVVVAVVAGKGSFEAGAALMLVFFQGDPDERDASGANENEFIKNLALAITPSAWKKAYQGEDGEDGAPAQLLDLPAWQGEEARALVEPEAVACMRQMRLEAIEVPGVGQVDTCFISLSPENPIDAPPVMLIHGFDSSVLEFRYITDALLEAGLRVEAMEWWTGGFTARAPFERAISEGGEEPWDLIRKHQYAFWERQCGGEKAVVLGASLGGAVALDFVKEHPECTAGLILMDAGGESYAQPSPSLTSLAADPVTNLFQWRATNGLLPYPHVWAKEDQWRGALRAYLKSGGYQNKVGPELIREVKAPTLVLWGEEDDVLPVEDASKYEQDLPNCVGVTLIPSAQHAPALENPPFVAEQVIKYVTSKVWEQEPQVA